MMSDDLRELIFAIALENASKYGGKPNKGSVIGKLVYLRPDVKSKIKDLMPIIDSAIKEVENIPLDKQINLLSKYKNLVTVKKEESEELPPLPGAEVGKVVTRFAPNPDFVLHLGSVRPLLFSYLYAKKYQGKFILRFEDTDPRLKKPRPEFYNLILEDLEWLGIKPDEVYYQSDRLDLYYDVARRLLENGLAYVCTCKKDEFTKLLLAKSPCPHREDTPENNLERFDMMLNGEFEEGEAVLRIKTDLTHPNPSVRDWAALRIIDTEKYPHPRTGSKYRVWPLYNFSCAIDDHFMGVTHVIRGSEHKINEEKQKYIYKHMGWIPPIAIHHGRVAIPGGVLSKSKIIRGIEEGTYSGIDDPRLATLVALRRRGYQPEAIKKVMLRGGLKASLTTIDWSLLAAENRAIIDDIANRYFGVREPKILKFNYPSTDKINVTIRFHPEHPERGVRKLYIPFDKGYKVLLDAEDFEKMQEGITFRLIALGNFQLVTKSADEAYAEYLNNDVSWAKERKIRFIHWLPLTEIIKSRLIYPGRDYEGYIEGNIISEKVGNLVQLERIGFFKIENLSKEYAQMIFTHE